MPSSTGPHLAMAVFCEHILQEKDDVLSAIRIIDRLIRTHLGPDSPREMEPFVQQLNVLVTFRSDQARGPFTVGFRPETPDGRKLDTFELAMHLEGEERGANLVLTIPFEFPVPGLYWFDVLLENEPVTRIPLRVLYQPQPGPRKNG